VKTAIYPGSFDPVTLGHLDIIKRSAGMFDKLIVLVLKNSAKKSLFTAEERVSMMEGLVKDMPNVCVDTNDGLLVDYAKEKNATIVIRGLRTTTDFEYELQLAHTNNMEYKELETIFLATGMEYSYLSSTVVKEFASYHGDISRFVPPEIVPLVEAKYK
jgi:pantetheine-phosphate adenylyltransferase